VDDLNSGQNKDVYVTDWIKSDRGEHVQNHDVHCHFQYLGHLHHLLMYHFHLVLGHHHSLNVYNLSCQLVQRNPIDRDHQVCNFANYSQQLEKDLQPDLQIY